MLMILRMVIGASRTMIAHSLLKMCMPLLHAAMGKAHHKGNETTFRQIGFEPIKTKPLMRGRKGQTIIRLGRDTVQRPEERRVGKECVSTCRYRWLLHDSKNKHT